MPSSQQPSFASAAAGQAPSRDPRGVRGDGRGSGDWARRDNRGPNGTLTLRRSSTTPYTQSSSIDTSLPTPIESSQPSTVFENADTPRYSKEQLLDIYKAQKESGGSGNVSQLLHSDFDPWHVNGTNGRASWGKSTDGRDNFGPAVCWDKDGVNEPIGLQPLSEEEKIAFAGDINSPLKPPPQNSNKEGNLQTGTGRKTSISHGQGNAFNASSPASSRPSTRRQQTADSVSGLSSPLASRFSRDENSPFFRKFGDSKEVAEERTDDPKPALPFGGLMRANTAGGLGGPGSPWGSTTAAMSPMGNFGSFPISQTGVPPTPTEKRPGFGSIRGESRLAHLMPKESSEDLGAKNTASDKQWRSRPRTDTDPFGDEPVSGSAALGGGQDDSPSQTAQRVPGSDTPVRGNSGEFGLSEAPSFRDSIRGQVHQTPQKNDYDPLSPSNTNPYASPADQNRHDGDTGSYDDEPHNVGRGQALSGIPEHQPNVFGGSRTFTSGLEGSDRSQTSSATGSKPFPPLGGIHNLSSIGGGWPTSGNPIGTPDRESRGAFGGAFGSTLFGNTENVQSPSLGPIGGLFGHGSSSNLAGTAGRGSKLGSLFPAAMQAQMHVNDHDGSVDSGDLRQHSSFGAIGRGTFSSRETDSPIRTTRHPFEDLFPPTESSRTPNAFSSVEGPGQTSTAFPPSSAAQPTYQQSQASSEAASNQIPATQQRMMVMPDRMRWVYLDPQGQVQGPWSGLEMHDWYKASFFTADLSVKKVEDAEFEPLGQLIRRIGNSREPFLVPQIGIPHGPPAPAAGAPFTPSAASGSSQPGSVQPPFAGAFPSFGTTLTAEQQNNLERRKQEEQYLMARQREFLAQQQVNMRQMQALPSALHHHSSAHSLHSQPSLGSLTSPIGLAPQAHLPGVAGFFDQLPPRQGPNASQPLPADFFRDDEFARLGLQDRSHPFSNAPQQQSGQAPFSASFPQNVDTSREASRDESSSQDDPQGFKARHEEFLMYQRQNEAEADSDALVGSLSAVASKPIGPPQQAQAKQENPQASDVVDDTETEEDSNPEVLSMTQQVQKAVSNKEAAINAAQPESPWAKITDTGLPMPFPPPQSTTPLPAPNPQRSRSNLPEALSAESRSRSETPETSAPSLAPWAKEPADAPRGPSLKEIQEAEAKKAALAEEAAIAARRAQAEQQLKLLNTQNTVPAPGLPTSSTWGTASSPAPTTSSSPWAKPSATKTQVTTASAASKKTLADIQREEESRKQKLAAVVAATTPAVQGSNSGKRYADLAGKPSASVSPVGGTAWNTVGAGGKVKVPTGPSVTTPQISRAVSSAAIPSAPSRVTRPVVANRSTSTMIPGVANNANDEFNKWAKGELTKGLNPGVDVDSFVELLANFPQDASIIADSVYGSSKLMDGRRFAEEYLRRRKLADKGIVEPAKTGSASGFNGGEKSGGGWSEVAKKGPPKEEPSTAGFKVVPNKKKGKK